MLMADACLPKNECAKKLKKMNRNLLVILLLIPFMIVEIIIETGYKKKDDMKSQGAIRKIMVTTVAGDGTPGYVDGPVTNAKFRMPLDVAVRSGSCFRSLVDLLGAPAGIRTRTNRL